MYDVAIITSIYDSYDVLKPIFPQEEISVEWIFVTDNLLEDSLGWTQVHEPKFDVHPNRAAKQAKMLPWGYTEAPASIWIDGSFRITSPRFAVEALSYANPIAQFKHPWRNCLFEESEYSTTLQRYSDESILIKGQSNLYQNLGHPEKWGLWATGIIARQHTDQVMDMGFRWFYEVNAWSYQDQISEPFVLKSVGLFPNVFPNDYFSSSWIRYEGSGRH